MFYEKDNAGIENFKNLTSYFHDTAHEILELLIQKGVFPYTYLDGFDKLEYSGYPNYESFYDNLKDRNIEKKEYERGKKFFYSFNCKSFKEYMELYLTCDVLILADCFEAFRDLALDKYELDQAHYISSPGLSWDAMLKYTGIELKLLTDEDMLYMFMEGMRWFILYHEAIL